MPTIKEIRSIYESQLLYHMARPAYRTECFWLEKFFSHYKKKTSPWDFTQRMIYDYFEGLTLRRTTQRDIFISLNRFWNWMVRWDYATYNPVEQSRKKVFSLIDKLPRPIHNFPTEKELLDACKTVEEMLIVLLAGSTGLKPVEIAYIRWDQIQDGILTVAGKNGPRQIHLRAIVLEALRAMPKDNEYVFFIPSSVVVRKIFQTVARKTGIPAQLGRYSRHCTLLRRAGTLNTWQDLLDQVNFSDLREVVGKLSLPVREPVSTEEE